MFKNENTTNNQNWHGGTHLYLQSLETETGECLGLVDSQSGRSVSGAPRSAIAHVSLERQGSARDKVANIGLGQSTHSIRSPVSSVSQEEPSLLQEFKLRHT